MCILAGPSANTNNPVKGDRRVTQTRSSLTSRLISSSEDSPATLWYTSAQNCSEAPVSLTKQQVLSNNPFIAPPRRGGVRLVR